MPLVSYAGQPSYTPEQQQQIVGRLAQNAQQSQQERYDNSSAYEKKMFELTRQRVGGYADVQTDQNINLDGLTDAQKQSIRNTEQNNKLVKQALRGDFDGMKWR